MSPSYKELVQLFSESPYSNVNTLALEVFTETYMRKLLTSTCKHQVCKFFDEEQSYLAPSSFSGFLTYVN